MDGTIDSVTLAPKIAFSRMVARRIVRKYNLVPPIDVSLVATREGFRIEYDLIAVPAQCDLSERRIVIKKDDHYHRQRFSIAHELGHYFLRHDVNPDQHTLTGDQFRRYRDVIEAEANEFARELLLPLTYINCYLADSLTPAEMAGRFQVSQEVMWIALSRYRKLKELKGSPRW